MKTSEHWAVTNIKYNAKNKFVTYYGLAWSKAGAIHSMVYEGVTWKMLYKSGWRAVKVNIKVKK